MAKLTTIIQRNLVAALAVTFLAGVFIGLVVLGWGLWPVQWTNATPADLQDAWRRTYLSMAADSYALTGDAQVAQGRINALITPGHTAAEVAKELQSMAEARTSAGDTGGAQRLLALARAVGAQPPAVSPTAASQPVPVSPQAPASLLTRFLRVFGLAILVLVILAGLLLLVYFLQSRTVPESPERPQMATAGAVTAEPKPSAATPVEAKPAAAAQPATVPGAAAEPTTPPPSPVTIGPFVATYNLGDIDFDMSFGIEAPNGDFLGECGLGMAETIGSSDVQRVTAFEVWLFDKTDIRTVATVLASAHAYSDATLRTKLASRGEIVLAQPGAVFSIKTSSLKLEGRILDMAYASGDAPAQSHFSTFSVELRPMVLSPAAGQ